MRRRRSLEFLTLLAWGGLLAAGCDAPPRVGIGAAVSSGYLAAVRVAYADAMAEGGLAPPDTLFLAEASNRAMPAIELATAFVARPGMVGVVAHSNSAASLAASPIYNAAEVVQIAPTSTSIAYTAAGPYSFRLVPPDSEQGIFLARALDARWPGGARVVLLHVNDDYGRGLRQVVLAHLDTARHRVVLDLPHRDVEVGDDASERARGAAATAAAAARQPVDVVIWLGRVGTFREYLPHLRAALGPLPILGSDGLLGRSREDEADPAWRGVQVVDFVPYRTDARVEAFERRVAALAPWDAVGSAEMLVYDATRLLLAAVRDGARTGEEVRAWLMSLGATRPPWPGLTGPLTFTPEGHVLRTPVLVALPDTMRAR